MTRLMKWTVALIAGAVAFVLAFWFCWRFGYRLLPAGLSLTERLLASIAFASVLAAGVSAAVNWWAGRDQDSASAASQLMEGTRITGGGPDSRTIGQLRESIGPPGGEPARMVMRKSRIKGGKRGSTVVGQADGRRRTGDDDG